MWQVHVAASASAQQHAQLIAHLPLRGDTADRARSAEGHMGERSMGAGALHTAHRTAAQYSQHSTVSTAQSAQHSQHKQCGHQGLAGTSLTRGSRAAQHV
jgi:hypothetical protein